MSAPGGKQRSLGTNFVPGNFTVICGRGKIYASSSGNVHLKRSVQQHAVPYARAKSRIGKSDIVSSIISAVHTASPEAAFVRFEADQWWEVDDSFAREKVGEMFRDLLHTKYRSSSKAKLARNKLRNIQEERAAGSQQQEEQEEGKDFGEGRGERNTNTNSLLLGDEEGRGGGPEQRVVLTMGGGGAPAPLAPPAPVLSSSSSSMVLPPPFKTTKTSFSPDPGAATDCGPPSRTARCLVNQTSSCSASTVLPVGPDMTIISPVPSPTYGEEEYCILQNLLAALLLVGSGGDHEASPPVLGTTRRNDDCEKDTVSSCLLSFPFCYRPDGEKIPSACSLISEDLFAEQSAAQYPHHQNKSPHRTSCTTTMARAQRNSTKYYDIMDTTLERSIHRTIVSPPKDTATMASARDTNNMLSY
jgi:hypothetical protein